MDVYNRMLLRIRRCGREISLEGFDRLNAYEMRHTRSWIEAMLPDGWVRVSVEMYERAQRRGDITIPYTIYEQRMLYNVAQDGGKRRTPAGRTVHFLLDRGLARYDRETHTIELTEAGWSEARRIIQEDSAG